MTGRAPATEGRAKSPAAARRRQPTTDVAGARERGTENLRARYNRAAAKNPTVRDRMNRSSVAVAAATDYAVRRGLAANPLTRGLSGYGCGTGGGVNWNNYTHGNWNNWYWNRCYPSWCWSMFNCCSWWNPGYGWGWGACWGWGWYYSNWCYWPSYRYSYWPTYAYCYPSVVYQYVEVPVYVEQEEEEEVIVQAGGTPVGPSAPANEDLMRRAAAEYMALGDRAFVEARYGDAAHYYAKAIEYSPEDGVLYLVLSDALFATGDYHYAAFAVRRALELNPELAALAIDKHDFYGDPADFDRQLELLELYLADHFLDEDARLVLAANYHFAAQSGRCVELLDSPFSDKVKASEEGQLLLAAAVGALATAE